MKLLRININHSVYVKMGDKEFRHWHRYEQKKQAAKSEYDEKVFKKRVDKKTGLVEMQLSTYMRIFGNFSSGEPLALLPCHGEVAFEEKYFEAVTINKNKKRK